MAKKAAAKKKEDKTVNKSQAIRDYIASNKKASAAEVVDALGKKGVQVTTALVYNIKSTTGTSRKPGKKRTGSRDGHTLEVLDTIKAAKDLVDRAGGVAQAQAILEKLG